MGVRGYLRTRAVSTVISSLWVLTYAATAGAVAIGVLTPLPWVCLAAFLASLASMVFHVVRASLTRKILPVRLVIGLNVVVLAATALVRDRLSQQASAAVVGGTACVSYFCFFGWRLALEPPRPGEALRHEKELRRCHWSSQVTVGLVLSVEFVQFNALSFNPSLGAWAELHDLSRYYSYSFFVFGSEAEGWTYTFEQQLWAYCSLALGWVAFAMLFYAVVCLVCFNWWAERHVASSLGAVSIADAPSNVEDGLRPNGMATVSSGGGNSTAAAGGGSRSSPMQSLASPRTDDALRVRLVLGTMTPNLYASSAREAGVSSRTITNNLRAATVPPSHHHQPSSSTHKAGYTSGLEA